jgi:hypothetical protein
MLCISDIPQTVDNIQTNIFWDVLPCSPIKLTDISDVLTAFFITLWMEAVSTSETSVNFYQTTQHNNPEDSNHHHCDDLKHHLIFNIGRTAKFDCRVQSAYRHTTHMQLSMFYIPLVSYRIKNDTYVPRSASIQHWHFTILQSFFAVTPHKLERTKI